MAKDKQKAIQRLQEELLYLKQEIENYKKLFLEDDGKIDSEEQKHLDNMYAVIGKVEKRVAKLQKKQAAASPAPLMCKATDKPGSPPPTTAPAPSGTSPSELKFPAFLPKLSVTSGSIKYEHSFDADLHKKISKQKTFPICTGLRLGGEVSVESKASLKLSIQGAYKTAPAQLPKNEWSSYEVTSTMGANITSTGKFSLVLTDSLSLLAAKFGVIVECVFNNKQIDITNFFSGGKMTVEALALSCALGGSLGPGETLNEIYEAFKGESCPDFVEWTGKKYTLLQVGVSIEATDKGILPATPTVGLNPDGVKALTDDITAIYDDAKKLISELKPQIIQVALFTFPIVGFAYWTYQWVGKTYSYVTNRHGFDNNKEIYVKACEGVVQEIMERESEDPVKLKELAKIAKDEKALEARYQEHMKEAKNIQLIKDIYENLHKNTREGLEEAKENLNQVLTDVDLNYDSISEVKDNGDKYAVHFKVLVSTDGAVVIPFVKASISCNGSLLDFSLQDSDDTYDHATNEVYDGYWVEFSKADLTKALNGRSMKQSAWELTLHADYPGHFKDVDRVFNISNEMKKHL